MTNPIFYKRISGSSIQGDAYTVTEPNGTLVIANGGELRLHDGSVAGGNPVGGGGSTLVNGSKTVSLDSGGNLTFADAGGTFFGNGYLQSGTEGRNIGIKSWDGRQKVFVNETNVTVQTVNNSSQAYNWVFNKDGTIEFPDNKISQVSDSNLGVQTSKSLTTDNIIANGSEFNTDQNVNGFGVINGWSQRNSQQIEMNLFVAPAPIWALLTGLALGRTVIVTYSTGSGNQTFTGVLSQLFTATGQYDQSSRQRYSGRIDGTIPANQTGIVSINFPEYSTQDSVWTFGIDGKLTFPNGSTIDASDPIFGVPITTTRGSIFLGNQAECAGGENHFHIMKAGQQEIDLFLGDDNNYVKLPSTGGVEISSSEIGAQHYWRFDSTGGITFPDNTVQTTAYVTGNPLIWAATDNGHGSITQAVAYDSQGNSYSLISQGNINNSGVFPATIVKRSGTGSELWKIDLGTDHSVNPWSLVCDGDNNLYAIVQRLNGSVYNNVVIKLNGADGSILWQVDIQDSQNANNMQAVPFSGYIGMGPASGVIVAGTAYNGSDNDFFITALGADGSFVNTLTYGDEWDQEAYSVAINPMSLEVVLVGRKKSNTDNANYLEIIKFVSGAPPAWQKSITVDGNYDVQASDVCLLPDGNWAVLATHSINNNNNYGVITMKINNTNGSVVWSREISQGCINISSSIATDSAGNIYMSAMTYSGNNTPSGNIPITNRLIGAYDTNGNALWQKYFRTFDTSEVLVDPNWWNNIGSTGKQLAVYNDRLLVGTSVVTLEPGPTGASAVVVQLTTQGENETIGAYETRNSYLTDSAVSLTVADTVFDYTTSTQTLSTGTSVSTASSTLTFSLEHTGAYVSQLKNGGKTVALETNGTLLDGNGRNVTGEFDGVTDSGNNFSNTPIGIRNASGYKRLVGLTNSAQTWFDINTVAAQLGVNPAWIMGLTVEYQVTSSNFANIGSMTGQIIIASSNNSGRDISVAHSEAVLTKSNSTNDVVFANLNFWQPSGWTLQAVRTDSNSQQLDIIWTAKVFINASEDYC